jgi:hypothetical protein
MDNYLTSVSARPKQARMSRTEMGRLSHFDAGQWVKREGWMGLWDVRAGVRSADSVASAVGAEKSAASGAWDVMTCS